MGHFYFLKNQQTDFIISYAPSRWILFSISVTAASNPGIEHRSISQSASLPQTACTYSSVVSSLCAAKKERTFLCPDSSVLWMVTTVRLITDVVTGDKKGIMYVKDIDAGKRRELEMIEKADRDEMTGVLNKAAFIRSVTDSLLLSTGTPAFVMLDIDNFKSINDTKGHPAGDLVLMAIAGILKDIFAADGIVGRLGGDEFAVFLPGTHTQDALTARLEQVLEQVKSVKQCNKAPSNVTCSIGVTFCDDKRSIEEIYKNADDALYRAKQNGKNQITFF